MLGGGPTERGEEPRARRRSSKRLLETGNPALHPEPRRGLAARGLPQVGFGGGPAAPQGVSPAARQVPSTTCLAARENHRHPLPKTTESRQLAGQRGVAQQRGNSNDKEKAVRSPKPA